LLSEVQAVALRMAEVTLREGPSANGGLVCEGKSGTIIDPRHECWPQGTVDKLLDCVTNTPPDGMRSKLCVDQRCELIRKNRELNRLSKRR
jgi:hypothetical protein